MTNDCRCKRCRMVDRDNSAAWATGEKVFADCTVYDSDGSVAAKRGQVGFIEDIDFADRWLIVSFMDNAVICYPHEVR
jgi:hypothetical protein